MHLTLKQETTRPPRANHLQQQEHFDAFRQRFNHKRPHEALDMACPGDAYTPSAKAYPSLLEDVEYALHDKVCTVQRGGHINHLRRSVYIATSLAGERLGLRQLGDDWLVSFLDRELGRINAAGRFQPC